MIRAEDVEQYLSDNPSFLVDRHELLFKMKLSAPKGDAIPLIETQAKRLRNTNQELGERLQTLVGTARNNDILFEKTRNLVLAMLEAKSVDTMISAMKQRLMDDFEVDFFSFISFNTTLQGQNFLSINTEDAAQTLGNLATSNNAVCGELRTKELEVLFQEESSGINSAAVQPFHYHSHRGLLVLGSKDPDRYRSSMGTLFLAYVGDVAARVLHHLQPHESPGA